MSDDVKAPIDRVDFAARLRAVSGMPITSLARVLGTTPRTIDAMVLHHEGQEATYRRILPRLEDLERRVAEVRKQPPPPSFLDRVLANYDAAKKEPTR